MKKLLIFISLLSVLSCRKQENCAPLRCKVTQHDYTICWYPDNKHQYVSFNKPEIWYLDTDECQLNAEILPMFSTGDTLGFYRLPKNIVDTLNTMPTTCECY